MKSTEFKQIVSAQDDLVREAGVDVWVGMEPTFTRRFAETPEWLSEALGPQKLGDAYQLLAEVSRRQPGGVVLHTLGRQYAGEDRPRWSIGYYQARQQQFTWAGPPDPFVTPGITSAHPPDLQSFWQALHHAQREQGWSSEAFTVDDDLSRRLVFRLDKNPVEIDLERKPGLARHSVHDQKIPLEGLVDDLARDGDYLVCLDSFTRDANDARVTGILIELPALPSVASFLQLLEVITQAATASGVSVLMMQGFPPPVDASVAWTTITPDPAVIEINQAPEPDAGCFYARCSLFYDAAQAIGLAPYRLHYNGVVSDSGGGGQFTLGGTTPQSSPFIAHPKLLPRLIRYFTAHPALSYWFAPPSVGSTSQSPRADEGLRDAFQELAVALEYLERMPAPSAEFIWRSLSPFLVDPSGNPHRSELNIEKLWNPYLPGRGCLGLVEFRAFRMSCSAECATAIAILLRSIVTMLCRADKVDELADYQEDLHTRYALPIYLQQDLHRVFADLAESGLPLHELVQTLLLEEPVRYIGRIKFHDCYVELQQAVEFWPLVGDVASQERGGSRLMDASTNRLQISLGMTNQDPLHLDGWELWVEGYRVPLQLVQVQQETVKVTGVRYRYFHPMIGLHPGITARNRIRFIVTHRGLDEALEITYHEWQPQGQAYTGLPQDLAEAANRRSERFITRVIAIKDCPEVQTPPAAAVSEYCFDLRRLPE